jgi:NitT/TauT family transport system ATP-binding protein
VLRAFPRLSVKSGEVVALLGRSGSGKSTLLRIMAGLIPPSEGKVFSNGKPLRGANNNVAMVFQSFALLPWLTVQENVELGLDARGVNRDERRRLALKAIDIVGLDGFESAYPKELSGGMKQRVGFARAFVLEPQILFMDEPFSALDILTSENLRGEIDDLWNANTFPSKSILIVTHNIEEAVFLADRVVILGSNPGRIRGEVAIDLPRPLWDEHFPREEAERQFATTVDWGRYAKLFEYDASEGIGSICLRLTQ